MLRASILLFIAALGLAAGLAIHFADNQPALYTYTGVEFCQGCHASTASGEIYQSWLGSPHARAYASLSSPQATEYLQKNSADINTCLSCHTTLGRAGLNDHEKRVNLEGIGCERCHGPGSNYSQTIIMKDRAAFTHNGGSPGSLANCYTCHAAQLNEQTAHCPFQTAPFSADSLWPVIAHSIVTSRSDSATAAVPDSIAADSSVNSATNPDSAGRTRKGKD